MINENEKQLSAIIMSVAVDRHKARIINDEKTAMANAAEDRIKFAETIKQIFNLPFIPAVTAPSLMLDSDHNISLVFNDQYARQSLRIGFVCPVCHEKIVSGFSIVANGLFEIVDALRSFNENKIPNQLLAEKFRYHKCMVGAKTINVDDWRDSFIGKFAELVAIANELNADNAPDHPADM